MKPCTQCKGEGTFPADQYSPERPCVYCKGAKEFAEPDFEAIRKEIFSSRKPYGLKKSVSSYDVSHRAYYVWRLANFHGGVDMTMPITAEILIKGDPFIEELDKFVDEVAKEAFGSDMKAALRWGKALGYF